MSDATSRNQCCVSMKPVYESAKKLSNPAIAVSIAHGAQLFVVEIEALV